MAQPLRKVRLKNTSKGDKPRRFTFSLSGAALAALSLVLATAVGWAFFMGFMVGRGQNPETRVEQMTGMLREEQGGAVSPGPDGAGAARPADPSAVPSAAPQAPGAMPEAAAMPPRNAAAAPTAPGNPAAGNGAAQAADSQSPRATSPAGAQPASPAYPFSRPQGESMAAWGIRPDGTEAAAGQAPQPAAQASGGAARNQPQNPAPARAEQAPLFDWLFQVAAFKDKADADKLRARLEGRGLRARQQKSGKVLLVMVSLRGTELDAANLREELKRMKLGAPVQASKKPVPGKSRKGK